MSNLVSFSIGQLFEGQWGYKPSFDFKRVDPEWGDQVSRGAKRAQTGGSPLWDIMQGREYYMPVTLDGIKLPYPFVSIRSRKNIVQTAMVGINGTVKEIIQAEDYDIVVRGFIVRKQSNDFPEDELVQIRNLYAKNEALVLECALTDIFLVTPERKGRDSVVITEMDFPNPQNSTNVRPYELRMISDHPFNLIMD